MFETLTMEQAGPVATVWMARPEVFNAFNEQLIEELTRACAVLEQDTRVRVVVLGGRGLHFSAGAPLAQKAAKELIAAVHGQPLDDGTCEDTAQRIARQRRTDEARDGVSAFLDKRPPAWMNP